MRAPWLLFNVYMYIIPLYKNDLDTTAAGELFKPASSYRSWRENSSRKAGSRPLTNDKVIRLPSFIPLSFAIGYLVQCTLCHCFCRSQKYVSLVFVATSRVRAVHCASHSNLFIKTTKATSTILGLIHSSCLASLSAELKIHFNT